MKGGGGMSEKEKKALENLTNILPKLPKSKQDYLLGYGDAIADMKKEQQKKEEGAADE